MPADWTGGNGNLSGYFWMIYLLSWPAGVLGTGALCVYAFTWPLCILITVARSGPPAAKVAYIIEQGCCWRCRVWPR
jgi:hypothetical protein